MKALFAFLIFMLVPLTLCAQILIETPNGVRRIRYKSCDDDRNCKMVEQTISYPICDEHHNCRTVNAFESGKAKVWEEEELAGSGVVFTVPTWA